MTKLNLALIVCAGALTFVTGAQALELKSPNGSIFPITIPSSSDSTPQSTRSTTRSPSSAYDRQYNRNGQSR